MLLKVERDSVCASDDADAPHAKGFTFEANESLAEALSAILKAGNLPTIAAGQATWIVEADKPLSVVAQQWSSPEFLISPATRLTDCLSGGTSRHLFFHYWCQSEPRVVLDCLKVGHPLPDRYGRDR